MAILNTAYYSPDNEGQYSDGSIETVLYERACQGKTVVLPEDEWAAVYHFSPLRHNILNWYPFRKDCDILEIGAGVGALTGLLTQRARSVTACELTLQRAKTNLERHKNADNLEILVGDFGSIPAAKKYDYVVINGVLEYAALMQKKERDPYSWMLDKARCFLNEQGVILLAIENRLGLKYFAGAPEDHIGKSFVGIDGYTGKEGIRTFDRKELEKISASAGLVVMRWYYPYPDYKFPMEIFTDNSINRMPPTSLDEPLDHDRYTLFNERNVLWSLSQNGAAQYFSNSFLVELAPAEKVCSFPDNHIDYVKISNDRDAEYAVCTTVDFKANKAFKIPLSEKSKEHLKRLASYQLNRGKMQGIPYHWDEEKVSCDLLNHDTLHNKLKQCAKENNEKGFWSYLEELRNNLSGGTFRFQEENEQFTKTFGDASYTGKLHWSENECIDYAAGNIFIDGDQWLVIDYEWNFSFPVPMEYILWRTLYQLSMYLDFRNMISGDRISKFVGVDEAAIQVFQQWEQHFQRQYVGFSGLNFKHRDYICLEDLVQSWQTAQNENINLHNQIETVQSENVGLHSQIETVQSENAGLHSQIETVRNDNANLHSQIELVQSDNANLHSQIEFVRNENANLHDQVESAQNESRNLQEELRQSKEHAQELDNAAIGELTRRLELLKSVESTISLVLSICATFLQTRIFRLAHFLSRWKYQRHSKDPAERKAFWSWFRGRVHRTPDNDHRYHPLYQIINPLSECEGILSSFISVAEAGQTIQSEISNAPSCDPYVSGKGDHTDQYTCNCLTEVYNKYDVIVFSVIDYDFRYQRPQQIADHFAREGHRVYYINANFQSSGDMKIITKAKNLHVVTLVNGLHSAVYSTDFNDNGMDLEKELDTIMIREGIRDALIIADYPTWYSGIHYLKDKYGFALVTDYMDDYTGFQDTSNSFLEKLCIELLRESDVVVASSKYLTERAGQYNACVMTVRNGTEFDHFHQAFGKYAGGKIIGYYGAIAHWFDYKKIQYLSRRFPDADIVLIGSVTCWEKELKRLPNVKLLGEKPYQELPEYLATFDVCLIPFDASTSLIQATNPVKFYEYLSAGKKIVATEIPELEPFRNRYVYLANDDKQFGDYVELCLKGEDTLAAPEDCAAFARENDWSERVRQFGEAAGTGFPKVSIIVLCYNQLDYTRQCVESIFRNTAYPNYELVLVDNNSKDGTAAYLQQLAAANDRVKIILNTENRGFAGGNNDGIEAAEGDYIVLLNNDTLVTRGWITNMVKRFRREKTGVVGPISNSIGNEAMVPLGYYRDISRMPALAYCYTAMHMGEDYPNDGTLAMFCFMFSREVFENVGPLDENYGVGMFEDDDYCMATRNAGYDIVLAEDVYIHHYGSVSFKKLEDEKYKQLFETNKAYYEKKWHTKWKMHHYRPDVKPEL